MHTPTTGRLACLLLAAALATAQAHASSRQAPTKDPARARGSASAKVIPGSEESSAERARRLKRECKGRPNAGACLGHAS
jgi:hypothetical protein